MARPTPAECELYFLLDKQGKILLIFNAGTKGRRTYRGARLQGMESMSKLLKTGKQNVRSLAKVKARNKTCSAKLLAPYCYGRCRNQGELATL